MYQADVSKLHDLDMDQAGAALRDCSIKPGEMFGIYKDITVPRDMTFDKIEDEIESEYPGSNPIIRGPEKVQICGINLLKYHVQYNVDMYTMLGKHTNAKLDKRFIDIMRKDSRYKEVCDTLES